MSIILGDIQQAYYTAAQWTAWNGILLAGQKGIESDTLKEKVGDGVTVWNSLTYSSVPAQNLSNVLGVGNTTGNNDIIQTGSSVFRNSDSTSFLNLKTTSYFELYSTDATNRYEVEADGGSQYAQLRVHDIATGLETTYFQCYPTTAQWGVFSATAGNRQVQMQASITGIEVQVSNFAAFAGIQYINDHSANYTNRSLVDKGYVTGNFQPLDSDLTSWAGVTRASGFDTFVATPSSANLASLVTDETGSGALVFGTSPTFTTDITTPLIIGGSAVGSTIQYKGTTGNGTSTVEAHQFLVGNNGNVTALKIFNSGIVQGITIYATSNVNSPVIYGGTTASQNLTLSSTEHATKGRVLIGSSSIFNFDQTNIRFGIGVNPDSSLHIKTAGGANLGVKIETTGASTYAPIDFQTPTGLAGQFLATSASFSSGIFSGNQLALASYVANGVLIASSYGFKIATGGLLTTNEAFSIDANANIICGRAAIATNATNGFLYVPTCAGTPTGVPTTVTGRVPIVADSTNNKLYIYSGGAWVALN